jgi:fructokinase
MKILSFGEVLWDIFGDEYLIGGAAFNFCGHLAKLGAESYIVTAVGKDELGDRAMKETEKLGVKTDFIRKVDYPTGRCDVTVKDGTPTYKIAENVAYDYIPVSENIFESSFDAIYFGTLSARNEFSYRTIETILEKAKYREVFCDINIRQTYYSKKTLKNCLDKATILKLSRDELFALKEFDLAPIDDYETMLRYLSKQYDIKVIILTLDKEGAMVYMGGRIYISPKPQNKPVSTVGAGDSFSACFLYNYLSGNTIETCLERAVALSDYVVTKTGAIPEYTEELLKKIK